MKPAVRFVVACAATWLALASLRAEEPAALGHVVVYRVESGETRTGDAYVVARTIAIDGTHQGDLNCIADDIRISGVLTGDLQAGGKTIDVDGRIDDSVRVFAQTVHVNGKIDGDLLVIGESLFVGPNAHVTGRLFAVVRQMTMDGTIDGPVFATGGEISISGHAGRSVKIRAESVSFTPTATIAGDLDYSAREELPAEARPVVGGAIHFEPRHEDDEEESSLASSVLWWMWRVAAALIVGFVGLALFRGAGTEIAATVGREWALALGSGFITFVVAPVVGTLLCVLIVTIPLMMLAFVLYLALLYVAKLPVALWIGGRVLRLLGRATPSPAISLAIGVPLLYLIFEIPILWFFAWCGTLCIGLGAILLGTRRYLRLRRPLVAPVPGSPA